VTGPDLPAGRTVEVTGAEGVVLQVRPVRREEVDLPPDAKARAKAEETRA
jgi:hypothetical protein